MQVWLIQFQNTSRNFEKEEFVLLLIRGNFATCSRRNFDV